MFQKEIKKEESEILPCFKTFLNTYIKDWEVHKIKLNKPFDELLNFNNPPDFGTFFQEIATYSQN